MKGIRADLLGRCVTDVALMRFSPETPYDWHIDSVSRDPKLFARQWRQSTALYTVGRGATCGSDSPAGTFAVASETTGVQV